MTPRLVSILVLALAILAPATALAKEGAVTKFDSLPTAWHAGETYPIGYTILMDGIEPYRADRTAIVARSLDRMDELVFAGAAQGAPGHYVATVRFPSAGRYSLTVTQGSFFPAHEVGAITVLAPLATQGGSTPATPVTDALREPLLAAAAAASALVALLLAMARRRHTLPSA